MTARTAADLTSTDAIGMVIGELTTVLAVAAMEHLDEIALPDRSEPDASLVAIRDEAGVIHCDGRVWSSSPSVEGLERHVREYDRGARS